MPTFLISRSESFVIKAEMIKNMQSGSVIYDLAAIQGGNTSLTKVNEIIDDNGVKIMGEKNILNKLPTSSSSPVSYTHLTLPTIPLV